MGYADTCRTGEFASLSVLPADHSCGDGRIGELFAADIIADPVMAVYTSRLGLPGFSKVGESVILRPPDYCPATVGRTQAEGSSFT